LPSIGSFFLRLIALFPPPAFFSIFRIIIPRYFRLNMPFSRDLFRRAGVIALEDDTPAGFANRRRSTYALDLNGSLSSFEPPRHPFHRPSFRGGTFTFSHFPSELFFPLPFFPFPRRSWTLFVSSRLRERPHVFPCVLRVGPLLSSVAFPFFQLFFVQSSLQRLVIDLPLP